MALRFAALVSSAEPPHLGFRLPSLAFGSFSFFAPFLFFNNTVALTHEKRPFFRAVITPLWAETREV